MGLASQWEYFTRHDQWVIGMVKKDLLEFQQGVEHKDIDWLIPPSGRYFYADPFGIEYRGQLHVFFEIFDYKTNLGHLGYCLYDNGWGEVRDCLREPFHLSYPNPFFYQGELYIIPESCEAGELRLYRFASGRLEFVKTLISRPLIDTSLYSDDQGLWIFCSDYSDGHEEKYQVFHAPDIMGKWNEHPQSPIKNGLRSSRQAGNPLFYKNQLYRFSQDCEQDYGGKITVSKIKLDPNQYLETEDFQISPPRNSPYNKGIHTLSHIKDNLFLIDAKKKFFSRYKGSRIFFNKLKKIGNRFIP